ncbi:MAG: diaminopimelate decarboxylase [Phycisphaeraceae bacterium]|nr:diaminopimelate decarboxylase [Phycisphaeraceae bacterium]
MDDFHYQQGQLYCEKVNLEQLAAAVGTPVYVYSRHTLETHYDRIAEAFAALNPLICYSIKSCGNIHLCKLLAQRGAGMDVVSGGELHRARLAGVDMAKVVYAGVGKTDPEIRQALEAGIGYFNIESEAEFQNIASIARAMNVSARAALRVNPDVDPKTHAKTTTGKKETKFGVDIERAHRFFERYGRESHLRLCGIHLHIGSPIFTVEPYVQAIEKVLALIAQLRQEGIAVGVLDLGGGFGADYQSEQSPSAADYAAQIVPLLQPFHAAGGQIILEPGRTIAANAGMLLSRVLYLKTGGQKKFIIVDTGMHHLVRPTMYDAFHFIWPTNVAPAHEPKQRKATMDMPGLETCDVVGPICETGDFLARDRALPPVARGDLLAIFTAGAYGMVMASNYNAMPRPPEVLVDGKQITLLRRRETYDDLVAPEIQAVTGGAVRNQG